MTEITARARRLSTIGLPALAEALGAAIVALMLRFLPLRFASHFLLARLERLHGLFVNRVYGLFHDFAKPSAREDAVIAWMGNVDLQDLLRLAGPGGHDNDAVTQEDRFLEIVRYKE